MQTKRRYCAEFEQVLTSRRGFLTAGAIGTAGLALPALLRAEATAANPLKKNVILLWMRGGPSHIDMWDPKPDAPAEYRGEFKTLSTKIPGIQLTDELPLTAGIMDQWSIVRSLYHTDAGHSSGDQMCFTGYPAGREPDTNVHPSCGSVVAQQVGHLTPELPSYVMIPQQVPGTGAAYLGVAYKPFETLADPAQNVPFKLPSFSLAEGLTVERLGERRALLRSFDHVRRQVQQASQMEAVDRFQAQAWQILSSAKAAHAFDLDQETTATRERYGLQAAFDPGASNRCGAPNWAQRMLLARRLVEAGVRLVTVDLRWWDTHVQGFDSLRRGFLPRWDRAYTALIQDLAERDLLKDTLVVAWGEFGRTPRVNNDAGRDHYPNVFSAALAGGPIQGGRVLGSSDSKGAFPAADAKLPQDVLATIYDHLGVDTQRRYLDNSGRPHATLPFGTPLRELY